MIDIRKLSDNLIHATVFLDIGRQLIGIFKNCRSHNLYKLLVDITLQSSDYRIGNLGSNRVFLLILVKNQLWLCHFMAENIIHIIGKIFRHHYGTIKRAVFYSFHGFIFGINELPVNFIVVFQLFDDFISGIMIYPFIIGISFIQRHGSHFQICGITVGIPVRIDIAPGVERRQKADTDDDNQCEEAL